MIPSKEEIDSAVEETRSVRNLLREEEEEEGEAITKLITQLRTSDPGVNWTGEGGLMGRAADMIKSLVLELQEKKDKYAQGK